MPNSGYYHGEPDGLPIGHGHHEPHRVSTPAQAYYDYRDEPEADDPTPEQNAANRRSIALMQLAAPVTFDDGYEF